MSTLTSTSLPTILSSIALGALTTEITSCWIQLGLKSPSTNGSKPPKCVYTKPAIELFIKISSLGVISVFVAFSSRTDWRLTVDCDKMSKALSLVVAVLLSLVFSIFTLNMLWLNPLQQQQRKLLKSIQFLGCVFTLAGSVITSLLAWQGHLTLGSCSTSVDRWFGVFYAVPLVLVLLPSTAEVVIQLLALRQKNSEEGCYTEPPLSGLAALRKARSSNRADIDGSFHRAVKEKQRANRIRLMGQILVHHMIMIIALTFGAVIAFASLFNQHQVNFAYLPLALSVLCISCLRVEQTVQPLIRLQSGTPNSSVDAGTNLSSNFDPEKALDLRPRTASSSGASKQGYQFFFPSGQAKALLHQFSKNSLRSGRSKLRSKKSPVAKEISDPSVRNSSNDESEVGGSILQTDFSPPEPQIPALSFQGTHVQHSLATPPRKRRSPKAEISASSRASDAAKNRDSSETQRSEKKEELIAPFNEEEAQMISSSRSSPDHLVDPMIARLTPPLESRSQEDGLLGLKQKDGLNSSSSDVAVSMHTALTSGNAASEENLKRNLQPQQEEEDKERTKLLEEIKSGPRVDLRDDVAEEERLEKIKKEIANVPIEDINPGLLHQIIDERGFALSPASDAQELTKEELFEQALSVVDDGSDEEASDSFLPPVAPSTEASQVSQASSFGLHDIAANPHVINNARLAQVLNMEKQRENPWGSKASSSQPQPKSNSSGESTGGGSSQALTSSDSSIQAATPPNQPLRNQKSALSSASSLTKGTSSSNGSQSSGDPRQIRASFDTFGRR